MTLREITTADRLYRLGQRLDRLRQLARVKGKAGDPEIHGAQAVISTLVLFAEDTSEVHISPKLMEALRRQTETVPGLTW